MSRTSLRIATPLASILLLVALAGAHARADEAASPPVATKRQMMKECMAKQKASDAGMSKEQMKKNCKDITQTERENAKANQQNAGQTGTPRP